MNSIQMCMFLLHSGELINIFQVTSIKPWHTGDKYQCLLSTKEEITLTKEEYNKIKSLYSPSESQIL